LRIGVARPLFPQYAFQRVPEHLFQLTKLALTLQTVEVTSGRQNNIN